MKRLALTALVGASLFGCAAELMLFLHSKHSVRAISNP